MRYVPNANAKAALDVALWAISHAGAATTSLKQATMHEIMEMVLTACGLRLVSSLTQHCACSARKLDWQPHTYKPAV